jgi:hypothetical protein
MEDVKLLRSRDRHWKIPDLRHFVQPRIATLVLFGTVVVCGGIVAAWFAGEGSIDTIFWQFQFLQENPPMWLMVPMVTREFLIVPSIAIDAGENQKKSFDRNARSLVEANRGLAILL